MSTKSIYSEKKMPPEFKYLSELLFYRIKKNFNEHTDTPRPLMPHYDSWYLEIKDFAEAKKKKLPGDDATITHDEATLLLLAIAPHIEPELLDQTIQSAIEDSGEFPQLGGIRPDGKNFRGFLPTGETALFLLGEDNYHKRLEVRKLFSAEHFFSTKKILWLEELSNGEPVMSGRIVMSLDYIETFIHGKPSAPHFSSNFPAKKIEEKRSREKSLVINDVLAGQVNEISTWVKYNECLMGKWKMADRLRKGYRALFYGPPGTGKTLTAGILGNELKKEVYKIDISMVVSKYIGETEKNLELLFARAEDKGWILFFDEADALFGKRTDVRDAHDKYANQEVSYLLQRIEDYNGLIILATNKKNNIDDAFIRRFNAVLQFSFPSANERASIWEKSFPEHVTFVKEIMVHEVKKRHEEIIHHKNNCATIDAKKEIQPESVIKIIEEKIEYNDVLKQIRKYELSGANILNIVHYASLMATQRKNKKENEGKEKNDEELVDCTEIDEHTNHNHPLTIYLADIMSGIKKELTKEGKPFVEIN